MTTGKGEVDGDDVHGPIKFEVGTTYLDLVQDGDVIRIPRASAKRLVQMLTRAFIEELWNEQ